MCQQSKMISFLRQQVLGFIQFNRTSGSLRRAKSSRLVSKRGAGRALATTYLLSAVACALLLPVKAWSVEAGSPNTEVLIEVAFDGLRQRSNGPTDTAVDGAGAHTPGLDGQNGAIPSQQNGVVRTNDSVGYNVHWNVNDVDSAASPNAELTDGIATNVVITIDTGRPDVFFEELSDRCLTRGAGLNPVSSFTARGTSPNGGALLICNLGDVVEGTGGTVSPVVTVAQKLDGSPSDGDVVPMQASITTDQSGDVASNIVNTTISAAPAADWVKGVPNIIKDVDNAGVAGAVMVYPLALELAGADSFTPERGVDNFEDVPITFYDHAWDLTPNATLLPAAVGTAIGRTACGPYDGSGSYPYGDGLSGDALDNEVNSFTMVCQDLGGMTGVTAAPGDVDNGIVNYPLIEIVISGHDTTSFPKFFANGVSAERSGNAYVISAQVAFWIPQTDLDAKDPLGGAPNALNDYFNTINADDSLDTTGADAPTGVVPNTEAIVLVPGVVDVVETEINNNGRVAVITDVPPPPVTPGAFQYSGYNHEVSFYKGPYKELVEEIDAAARVESRAADGRDPIVSGIGREGDFFLNNGQDAVSRNELLTIVAKAGAGSTDHGRIDDDPVHLCVELDNTYMDLIDFPSDFQITTLPQYSAFTGGYSTQTDLDGGYPPVSVTTGSPSNGLAHVIMGASSFSWFDLNYDSGFTYKQMWGIFDDGDNPDYVVEVAEVPLAASDPENRLVNETTCNDAEATWVDATDTAALAALVTGTDTDGNNVYGNVTKVRVRMLERHNWRGLFYYQDPDFQATRFSQVTAGIAYQLALQTRVKPEISLTPIDEHIYVHAARGRGDWVGQPEAGVAPAPLTKDGPGYCAGRRAERRINLGNWMSIDNPNPATVNNGYAGATGWCSLAYNNTNEKHYIDGLDLDPGAFESRSDDFRSTGQDGTSQSGDPTNSPRSPIVIAHADMVNIVEAQLTVNKTNLTGITNLAVNGDEYTFEIETSIVGSPVELFGDVTVTDLITSGAGHANFEFVSMTAPVDADDNPITGTANCTDSLAGVFGDVQCVFSGGAGSGDYRSSPFYAKFQVTVRMVSLRANQRYQNTVTASAERLTIAGGSYAPQVFETKIGNDVVYSAPEYNEITVRKDVPDLGGDCTVDPGSSAVAANTLFAGDCSVFRIGDEYSYVLTVDNNGLGDVGSVVIIDALPHTADGTELAASFIGTPAGTDAGDGRTPASNFSGTSELVSITTTGGGATVECTSDPVANINRNPDDNTNAWGATCDSTSTGFRVTFSALNASETKTVTVNLLPADSAKSDIYTNNFGARAANIDVPVRSNDVSAMIQGVSVGGTLWLDADYDSLQDANEPTIEGATVTLLDSNMVPIPGATVVTGPDGLYYFEHLPDGDYYVQVDVPSAEYEPVTTQGTSNSDIADDSSIATTNSPTQYVSDVITLSTGGEPDANTETGPISGTDDDADNALETNGNLTVDMGFMVVPDIELTKSSGIITDVNNNGITDAGDTIAYSFSVENTGGTILAPVTISDPKLGLTNAACVPTLAVGATATCSTTGNYTILQSDVEAGGVENVATTLAPSVDNNGGPLDDPANPGTPIAPATDTSDTGTDNGAPVTDPDTVETLNPLDENANVTTDPKDDPTTVLIAPVPGIELTKSVTSVTDVNSNGLTDAGDIIAYSFVVENTGNTILAPVTFSDAKLVLTNVACVDNLAVGATATCTTTGNYTILQADVEVGGVENVATATGTPVDSAGAVLNDISGSPLGPVTDTSDTGTDPDTNVITDPDTVETPNPLGPNPNDGADPKDDPTTVLITPTPQIEITKSITAVTDVNTNGLTDVGDTISYSFVVENTGSTILMPVTISDAKLGLTDVACVPTLAIGASATCTTTGSYTIMQVDVEAGGVENVATTTGTPVDSNDDPLDDPANPGTPLAAVTDTSDTGTDPAAVSITDPDTVETPNPLDENVNDTADPKDDPTTYLITPVPDIELTKSITAVTDVNGNGFTDAGDTVEYSFVVENTGNVILAPVTITDAKLGLTDAACADNIAVGATETCTTTATYTILQADVEAGGVENVATATGTPVDSNGDRLDDPANPGTPLIPVTDTSDTGTDPDTTVIVDPDTVETPNPLDENSNESTDPKDDPTTLLIAPMPLIEITKSVTSVTDVNSNGLTDAGDIIAYSFVVENTGNTILAPVTISDVKLGITDAACVTSLAVGATATCTTTGNYTILQADVEAGGVENVATTAGTPVDSNGVDVDDPANPGTPLGPVTDTSDTGTDPDTSVITDPDTVETPNPLGPNPNDGADPKDDPTTVLITPTPQIEITKSITAVTDVNTNGLTDVGDTISYSFVVENTGSTILMPVTISDAKLGLTDVACVPTLAIGASATCTTTGSYTIMQVDVEAGGVENVATTTGTPVDSNDDPLDDPANPGTPLTPVTDTSDTGTDTNGNMIPDPDTVETPNPLGENPNESTDPTDDPTTLMLTPVPDIELTKSITAVTDVNGNGFTDAGDTVEYSFSVENTGSTILAPVTISDAKLGLTDVACADNIAVGATETCTTTATYTILQADVEAGGVENVATATGTPVDSNGDRLDDPANPGTPLTPVTDTSDTGTDPDTSVITDPDTVETPNPLGPNPNDGADPKDDPTTLLIAPMPQLELTKFAGVVTDENTNGITDVGDTITYTFMVENTGNTILAPVTISDAKLGLADVACVATLAIGATATCTTIGSYAIVQADIDAGSVENVATTTGAPVDSSDVPLNDISGTPLDPVMDTSDTGTDPDGNQITDPDTVETPNPLGENPNDPDDPTDDPTTTMLTPIPPPSLIISKEFGGIAEVSEGVYRVTFNMVVINDGDVLLENVQIVDDLNAMLNNPVASGAQVSNASVVDNSAIAGTTPLVVSNTYTGTGDNNLLAPTGNTLVSGAIGNVSVSFDLTPARYYGPFNNLALATGVDPLGNVEMDYSENSATPTSTNGGGDFTSETPFGVTPPSTPITLGWFRASDNLNGTVNIEWQTETEIANAGFYLSSVDSDGNVKRLNETIILSQGDASSAQSYSFVATTEQTQFMLTDVGVAGKEVIHGPFNLGEEHGFLSKPRPIDWDVINQESEEKKTLREQQRIQEMQRKLNQFKNLQSNSDDTENKGTSYYVAKAAAFILSALVAPAQAIDLVSFEVEQAGVYEVTHQDLMNSGLDLRGIATNRIGLKENSQLWPVSINTGASASFTDGSSLVFAGRALSTLYSKINRYTLVLDEGQLGIEQDDTNYPGSDIALASSYLGEKVYAPQNKYSFYSPEPDDSWFADQLSAFDSSGVSKTVTLNISDYAPAINYGFSSSGVTRQPALRPALEVSLWGASTFDGNGAAQPDHHVLIDFNGQQVINSRFDGFRTKTEKAGLTSLQIGNNTIKVSVPKDTGYLYDIVMLDHITLKYPKKFVAEGQGSLVFNSNWSKFRVKGLDSAEATVIRMDADGNGYFMAQRGVGSCTNSCVYFAGSDTEQEDTYYVATNSGTLKPTVSVAADSAMSSGAAKYVIISHPDFIGTSSSLLENYANEITSQYGTVDLIDVETIYAEYSGGVVDAAAIAQFIEDAYHNRGTRHILLVGGDVYDYHDNLETGSRSFIPSIYTPVANNVTSVPSDASYALIDNDLVPDLSIARLPVRTTGELANLVTKRQRYLARDYGNKALFAADRLDASNYSFKSDSERLIFDHFRNNWSVDKVYYDDATTTLAQARLNIQNAINGGVGVVSYFGHSSADRWSLSGMLTADDVSGLNNFQKPTVVVQGGCSNTFYVSPNTEPMAHRFLVEGEQGAVTVMGASSYTQATAEKRMSGFLFKFLKQGMSIGDAVLAAKQQIAINTPYQLDVLLGWAVLGFDDMPVYQ